MPRLDSGLTGQAFLHDTVGSVAVNGVMFGGVRLLRLLLSGGANETTANDSR